MPASRSAGSPGRASGSTTRRGWLLRQTPQWQELQEDQPHLRANEIDGLLGYEDLFHIPEGSIPMLWSGSPELVVTRVRVRDPELRREIHRGGRLLLRTASCMEDMLLQRAKELEEQWVVTRSVADASRARTVELRIATGLLANLPAFPDADIGDVRDVRKRLEPVRLRFRGAMIAAARALADVPDDQFAAEVAAYRREYIDVPLADIRESLKDLGVASTLLRLTSDAATAATLASATIAAVMLDPTTVVAAGASVTRVSAAARETLARRNIKRDAQRQPYWYLHEAGRRLEER
jgi:hypothetical protein